jgi:hypothetical protein
MNTQAASYVTFLSRSNCVEWDASGKKHFQAEWGRILCEGCVPEQLA